MGMTDAELTAIEERANAAPSSGNLGDVNMDVIRLVAEVRRLLTIPDAIEYVRSIAFTERDRLRSDSPASGLEKTAYSIGMADAKVIAHKVCCGEFDGSAFVTDEQRDRYASLQRVPSGIYIY